MELNSTYDQIISLISSRKYSSSLIDPNLQYLASDNTIVLTVFDKSGKKYNVIVNYNPDTNKIFSPISTPIQSQYSHLINLPIETLHDIVVIMSLNDVLKLCQTNKNLNDNICNNGNFWKRKFIYDFVDEDNKITDLIKSEELYIDDVNYWKERYRNFGKVYSFGNNINGQLGLGDHGEDTNKDRPTMIPNITAKAISAGERHSLIIDINNRVWSFGSNYTGQLGLGDNGNNIDIPTMIPNITAKAISTGDNHSLIIDMENRVWSFGHNHLGQLGLGDHGEDTNKDRPTMIPNIIAKTISAGGDHSLIIDMENRVWSFGSNYYGQLGLGDHGENTDRDKPTIIPNIIAKSISTGREHSLIIDMENRVWSFGRNEWGQLGLGDHGWGTNRDIPTIIPNIKAKAISAGGYHSLIIDMENRVWSFGDNNLSQLGLGDGGEGTDRNKPIMISNITAKVISAGLEYSLLIDMNNKVWSFGSNDDGTLGLGDNIDRDIPTMIPNITAKSIVSGDDHTLLLSY